MLDTTPRSDIDGLERLYDEAVRAGGALQDGLAGALELLAQITTLTPHLALVVVELADAADAAAECAAVPGDPMAVPEQVAGALGGWLACYACADPGRVRELAHRG